MESTKNNLIQNKLKTENLSELELNYLLLSKPKLSKNKTKNETLLKGENKNSSASNKLQTDNNVNSLLYRVPDSIFKSGTLNEWHHVSDSSNESPYAYSYATFNFAGTDNRLTYLLFMDIPINFNFSSQQFRHQLTLRDNVSVMYNVYNDELSMFGDDNRTRVKDITLKHGSNNSHGVFNARYYAGKTAGSNLDNIAKAIITWIAYAGQGLSSYEHLTKPEDTQTGEWFTYPKTASAQDTAYDGEIIDEISAVESGDLRYSDDYFLIRTEADNISSINWGYNYSLEIK